MPDIVAASEFAGVELHDASLRTMDVDFVAGRMLLRLRCFFLEGGDGTCDVEIRVQGVRFVLADGRASSCLPGGKVAKADSGLWMDAGRMEELSQQGLDVSLPSCEKGLWINWLFVHEWNGFVFVCAREAVARVVEQ